VSLAEYASSREQAKQFADAISLIFEVSAAFEHAVDAPTFRVENEDLIPALDVLERSPFLKRENDIYRLGMASLAEIPDERAKALLADCDRILDVLRTHYRNKDTRNTSKKLTDIAAQLGMSLQRANACVGLLNDVSFAWGGGWSGNGELVEELRPGEAVIRFKNIAQIVEHLRKSVAAFSQANRPPITNDARRILETAVATYTLKRQIGQGGAATVWLGETDDGEQVAIKIMRPDQLAQRRIKRHQNEFRFGERALHRNLIRMLDSGAISSAEYKQTFFVMPYYEGTLRGLMKRGIAPRMVLPYFAQLLDGLEAAHDAGVVHRDLKPENILWNSSDESLVISDFGIARFLEEDLYTAVETQQAERLASFVYAAPEQRARGAQVSSATDVYALGLILNEMFTGEVLQGTGFRRIGSIDESFAFLDEIVDEMVRQNPRERPRSAKAVRLVIEARAKIISSEVLIAALTHHQTNRAGAKSEEVGPKLRGFDYRDEHLILELDRSVSPAWVAAFHGLRDYGYFPDGSGSPRAFAFAESKARTPATVANVKQIVEWFKQYLVRATDEINRELAAQRTQNEQKTIDEKRRQIAAEERRIEILRQLKDVNL
jgi:serine/threonine protein kinase